MLLRQLQTFAQIVDLGSITAAAERLHLSQPAVSRQLKSLESDLGARLCERRGHAVVPTPAGEVAYGYAQRMQSLERELHRQLASVSSPEAGDVTVACVDTIAIYTLPDILAPFAHRHPAVRVRVRTGPIRVTVDRLLAHEADVALTTVPVQSPRVTCRPLFDDPVALVATPQFAADLPDEIEATHLEQLPVIAYELGTHFRSFVDAALEERGIHPRVTMEFDGHEAVREVVGHGLGVAFVPESTARADIAQGRLRRLRIHGLPDLRRTTCLVVPRDVTPSPTAELFLEEVLQQFPKLP